MNVKIELFHLFFLSHYFDLGLLSEIQKCRLSPRTSGILSINHCNQSGYCRARGEAPGPRHPLDPVLKRHTLISHSAFLTEGIVVFWRSNRRYIFLVVHVCIFSIAFPFRTCCPFLLSLQYHIWFVLSLNL